MKTTKAFRLQISYSSSLWKGQLQSGETAFIARARPSHHLCRASDETGPAPASITRPARRCLEAGPWWASSRLPVVTRLLTELASRSEQRALPPPRYCVGGLAATACRISTAAKTSSRDIALMAVCPSIRDLLFCRSHPPGSLPLWNDHLLDVTQAPETLQSCVTLHNALRLATGPHRLCFIRVVGQMTTERLDIDTRKSQ